jgi:putative endonuclease
MWYVYIIKCADNTLYTGATTDVSRRIQEHNRKKGGACTRARLPATLAYKETYRTRSEALKREAQIKRWPRQKKLTLIDNSK